MVIFHSYVSLPKGTSNRWVCPNWGNSPKSIGKLDRKRPGLMRSKISKLWGENDPKPGHVVYCCVVMRCLSFSP